MNVPPAPGVDAGGRFLTFANLLSLARILLVVPFALVMLSAHPHGRIWGAVIMAIAAATDKFDGVVARRRGETTRWGHILDPLADKIAAGGVIVVLLILGELPPWFGVLALGRDGAIFATGIWLRVRRGVLLPPNRTGKWAVGVLALALVLLVLDVRAPITDVALGGAALLLVVSLALYGERLVRVLRGAVPPDAIVTPSPSRHPSSVIRHP